MKWTPPKLARSARSGRSYGGRGCGVRSGQPPRSTLPPNPQALGRKPYVQGLADANARYFNRAIDEFRAALSLDPTNAQYQLSLARALRDGGDPRRLDDAESYLLFGSVPLKTAPSISRSAA